MDELYGYVGKIARIDLTDSTVTEIPTSNYVPKYIGGRSVCNKIFWDEVGPEVGAFDPENKIIYMTGPTTSTGIPTGGRSVMTGISPNSLPEQYSWSGIGGWFGAEVKFAGYDGIIIEGKAKEPTYLFIEDGEIKFLSAKNIWGKLVHDTQNKLEEIHGRDVNSIVIGPAGENLMRNASITTSNDNVAAKSGFGAVFGSKNLKAITVRGKGEVVPGDVKKVLELRNKMSAPYYKHKPVTLEAGTSIGPANFAEAKGGYKRAYVACSHGCNQHCNHLMLDVKSAFKEEKVNHVEKCVSVFAFGFEEDVPYGGPGGTFITEQNHDLACKFLCNEATPPDETDPHFKEMFGSAAPGDKLDYWKPDFDKGSVINDLCNEYGIDKWDTIIWLLPWLSMGKKEGVFDDTDFGMEIDVESEEFVKYLIDMIVYRKGYYGNILAEGMARAIRILGKEKFGDTIYQGRYSQAIPGKQLDIPISLESAWGHAVHWQGRGYQGSMEKPAWVATNLHQMLSTRDTQTIAHHHDYFKNYLELKDDPCHSPLTAQAVIMGENKAELKDSITCCDWQSPNLYWMDMETHMLEAATGIKMTEKELDEAAERSKLLFRAIIIRNYGRDREKEVNAIFPIMTYPDPWGETVTWKEWNDLVDIYYAERGWDKETGWPTRETYTKFGLSFVADELEAIGKLPVSK